MFKLGLTLLLIVIPTLSTAHSHTSNNKATKITLKVEQIKPHVFVISGQGGFTGGNILVVEGDHGLYVVDDAMPPFKDQLLNKLQQISKAPVKFVINTHVHGDHIGNNAALAKLGAHIIGHHSLRVRLHEKAKNDAKITTKTLPVLAVDSRLSLHLNSEEAQILHIPNAHTDGDLAIYLPTANILHTGDLLFNELFPFIDLSSGGDVTGYLKAQKKLHAMINTKTVVVPGHGSVTNKQGLKQSIDMLENSIHSIEALIKDGKKRRAGRQS